MGTQSCGVPVVVHVVHYDGEGTEVIAVGEVIGAYAMHPGLQHGFVCICTRHVAYMPLILFSIYIQRDGCACVNGRYQLKIYCVLLLCVCCLCLCVGEYTTRVQHDHHFPSNQQQHVVCFMLWGVVLHYNVCHPM